MTSLSILYIFSYLVSGFILVAAVYSVTQPDKPHYAVIYLIAAFVLSAVLMIMQNVQFVGIAYILIYAAGVLVLFLFVIFLIDTNNIKKEDTERFLGLTITPFLFLLFVLIINTITPLSSQLPNLFELFDSLLNLDFSNFDDAYESYKVAELKITFTVALFALLYIIQVQALAINLYTDYFWFLIIIGLILLLTMLAVIILSKKNKK